MSTDENRKLWICTYDAARERDMSKTTFRRKAEKLGVRYLMGRRIWDGYEWNRLDLERMMPTPTTGKA